MKSIEDLSLDECQTQVVKVCTEKNLLNNDWISDLPDDILIRIVSTLTLKEAGCTSVLSKRWRNVWTHVPSLNFDAFRIETRCHLIANIDEEAERKYFSWVDQVVNSHKAHTIDDFLVQIQSRNNYQDNIDNWLKFAMEKRVKRLQLDIGYFGKFRLLPNNLPSLSFRNPLTSLQLSNVQVSGETLEKFLCHCPALEMLSVYRSNMMVSLKVAGAHNLKHLKIDMCGLKHLEIYAPNLMSFQYSGFKLSSPFKSTPKLVDVSIRTHYGFYLLRNFSDISRIASQLEALKVGEGRCGFPVSDLNRNMEFPMFPKLKMLHICMGPEFPEELFDYISLIKACPVLYKCVFQVEIWYEMAMTQRTREAEPFEHKKLKILEITGFGGGELECGFASYLIKGAVSLEKIIIKADTFMEPEDEMQERGRKEAERLLRPLIKPGLEVHWS